MPIIVPFGCLFFTFKFFIDKYNMVYIWRSNYQSDGKIRKEIVRFMLIGINLFSITMGALLSYKEDLFLSILSLLIILIILFLSVRLYKVAPWKGMTNDENQSEYSVRNTVDIF